MIPLPVKIWGLRVLLIGTIILLCVLSASGMPSWAIAISWSPNGLFLAAFNRGKLRFPRFLEPVHPVESVIYRWLGVGLVKRIVANRVWPMLHGFTPEPHPKSRGDFLRLIEHNMKAAEICHAATFVFASGVAAYYAAVDRNSMAAWIMAFNVLLNAYPVMLQRSNRWRMPRTRSAPTPEVPGVA